MLIILLEATMHHFFLAILSTVLLVLLVLIEAICLCLAESLILFMTLSLRYERLGVSVYLLAALKRLVWRLVLHLSF